MSNRSRLTRQADAKGRITLGPEFANRILLIEKRDGDLVIRPGRVIPEREAWLYENPKALDAVRRGLEQARSRKFVKGPDLGKASKLADRIADA